eukprot:1324026-Amphidinium_carterae.1
MDSANSRKRVSCPTAASSSTHLDEVVLSIAKLQLAQESDIRTNMAATAFRVQLDDLAAKEQVMEVAKMLSLG